MIGQRAHTSTEKQLGEAKDFPRLAAFSNRREDNIILLRIAWYRNTPFSGRHISLPVANSVYILLAPDWNITTRMEP